MVNDPRCQKLSDDLLKEMGKQPYKTNDRSVQQRSEESRSASDQPLKRAMTYHDIALSAFAT